MTKRTVVLKGLRGNYKGDYKEGHVVYRKYKKEWHIYGEFRPYSSASTQRTMRLRNSIEYVEANADLKTALQRAGKPLSTINDKEDNFRVNLADIQITYDEAGKITGHKLLVADPLDIKTHKEEMKARKEVYEKLPNFATFLAKPKWDLT